MNLDDAYELGWLDCQECIEKLPSAEPELKHAKWITSHMNGIKYTCYCSNCNFGKGMVYDYYRESHDFYDFCYCPHCGAMMDEEIEK